MRTLNNNPPVKVEPDPELEVELPVVDGELLPEPAEPERGVVPWTGEPLPALKDIPPEKLGELLGALKDWQDQVLNAFKHDLEDEIIRRLDARTGNERGWTMHLPGIDLSADSPDVHDLDITEVQAMLGRFLADGVIAVDDIDAVLPQRPTLSRAALATLCKSIPEIEASVREIRRPRRRRVTVKIAR